MTAMQAIETENLSYTTKEMLLKLRKGAAASLNAARLAEIFIHMSGWKIEKTKLWKPSFGGWIMKREVPGGGDHQDWKKSDDGRVYLTATILSPDVVGSEVYEATYRARDTDKINHMMSAALPQLAKLDGQPTKKWRISGLQSGWRDTSHSHKEFFISFEFVVQCGGFIITAPDGATFEVFGDYKNGAQNAKTFVDFYNWAVENSSFMQDVLNVLGMEPVPVKDDPSAPYTPPLSAPQSVKIVWAKLKELTSGVRAQQKINLIARFTKDVLSYVAVLNDENASKELKAFHEQNIGGLAYVVVKDKALVEDWEAKIETAAERRVEEMQNVFVYKNTKKLASIVEAKDNLASMETLNVSVEGGLIVGSMLFRFEDSSQFRVRNTIEQSYATDSWGRYTHFYRFPTRFHDVVMADGSKMAGPSEERVNTIFTGKKD